MSITLSKKPSFGAQSRAVKQTVFRELASLRASASNSEKSASEKTISANNSVAEKKD